MIVGVSGAVIGVLVLVGPFDQYILGQVAAIAIVVMGLNLLMGVAGLFSVASAAFVGLGATAPFYLMVVHGVTIYAALPVTLVGAWLVGLGLGLITLRVSGIYLAIVTFGLVEATASLLVAPYAFTGGGYGFQAPAIRLGPLGVASTADYAVITGVLAIAVGVLSMRLSRSRGGRAWRAVKEEPVAAELCGVWIARSRAMAFAYSTAFACLGGVMQALILGATNPTDYGAPLAVQHLSYLLIGGMGVGVLGPPLGVLLLFGLPNLFARGLGQYGDLMYGALMLAVVIVAPRGLVGILGAVTSRIGHKYRSRVPTGAEKRAGPAESHSRVEVSVRDGVSKPLETFALHETSVSFGGVKALDRASLTVLRGEIHGLIGPNGAGKTTLLNVATRVIAADSGGVLWNGSALPAKARDLVGYGIARTFQTPKVIEELTVLENVMVGAHRLRSAGMLRAGRRDRLTGQGARMFRAGLPVRLTEKEERLLAGAARDALELVDLSHLASHSGGELSFAERRKVELARCLVAKPELVLLDEPTSGLDRPELERLRAVCSDMRIAGCTIVVVEHNVPFVVEMCDRVTALAMGRVIATGNAREVVRDPRVVSVYLGEDYDDLATGEKVELRQEIGVPRPRAHEGGASNGRMDNESPRESLEVRDFNAGYGRLSVLRNVSFKVSAHEVVLVVGRNGVGKSTLLNAVAGVIPSSHGSVEWNGNRLERLSPRQRMRAGLGIVPQGGGAVIRGQTVEDNLVLAATGVHRGRRARREHIEQMYERFPLLAARRRERAENLSGGERQMLAIAKVLIKEPRVLLLDEPSAGLAPHVLLELGELLEKLRAQGIAICVAEQNVKWCRDLAARGYLIESGEVRSQLLHDDLYQEDALAGAYLGEGPSE